MFKLFKNKTLVVCAIFWAAIIIPVSLTAQKSDLFFKIDNEDIYENRATEGFTLGNDPFGEKPVPVGSGLLVLTVAGAGYAIARRKRSLRKGTTLLLAFALILGMTQCKKRVETVVSDPNNMIHLALNVGNNSRHEIIPNEDGYVPVRYLVNDVIYVGNGTSYIGTLTCNVASDEDGNNASFEGDIITPNIDDVLHFYFVGGLTPSKALEAGTTTDFTVDISNQSSKLPVLSYTTAVYNGSNSISCNLHNKCALVEFKLATGTNNTVKVSNMLSEAKIDFANPSITPTEKLDAISLYKSNTTGNTKRWAVLQLSNVERKSLGMVFREHSNLSYDVDLYDYYDGVSVPALTETNNYIYGDDAIEINNNAATINNKVFVVSANGNAVRFASGNLMCVRNGSNWESGYTWSFMEHQYDRVEKNKTAYCADDYADKDTVSLFGWGCTGFQDALYHADQLYYMPYNTTWPAGNVTNTYGPSGFHDLSVQNKSDWGAIVPNTEGYNWRLLTNEEWMYMLKYRDNASGKRAGSLVSPNYDPTPGHSFTVEVNGVIIIPEGVSGSVINSPQESIKSADNVFTTIAALDAFLTANDAVYLPLSGYRNTRKVQSRQSEGRYWTSNNTSVTFNNNYASYLRIANSSTPDIKDFYRAYGYSVRLVY